MNDAMVQHESFDAKCQKVLQVAKELFQSRPDWVTFFRETLGVSGAARNVFPRQEEYVEFEKSPAYAEIQNMVLALRTKKVSAGASEPIRVITVRLPESLHEALKAEAKGHKTSMNKLCITKLLQVLVDEEEEGGASQSMPASTRSSANPPANHPLVPKDAGLASPPSFRSSYDSRKVGVPGQERARG